MQVRSSKFPTMRGYRLIEAYSEEGKIRSYGKALEQLSVGPNDHGAIIGVGWISLHTVFRFNWDQRQERGTWSMLYSEQNGVLV